MVQTLMLTQVQAEYVAPVVGGLAAACVALWRRANVERDRRDAEERANREWLMQALREMVTALNESTEALREINRAG